MQNKNVLSFLKTEESDFRHFIPGHLLENRVFIPQIREFTSYSFNDPFATAHNHSNPPKHMKYIYVYL